MDQQTIDTYNAHAQNYDEETTDFWEQFPRTFFDQFTERTNGSVLNIGSGPGRDGSILQEAGQNVVCLDASQAMIEMSTSRGLVSVLGDLLQLPFEDASFDAVWAYTSLLHVSKAEVAQAFKEIRRVLKPGGVFGLGLIEGDGEIYRESTKVTMPRLFSLYQKEEVEEHLRNHGFKIEYFETFKPSSKNYLNFISRKCSPFDP